MAHKEQYISIKQILDNILSHPLLQDVTLERAVNYAVEFIRLIGVPSLFEEKVETLKIENYKSLLPCDFIRIIQVRDNNNYCFRYSTDSFHYSTKNNSIKENKDDPTYKIQGNIIYTSIKEATIEIAYESICLDDDGFPMIPNNAAFTKALEFYIKKNWFTILFDMSKITQQALINAQQDYAFYVKQASEYLKTPTIDEMESLSNLFTSLVSRVTEHRGGFKSNGSKEYLKLQ